MTNEQKLIQMYAGKPFSVNGCTYIIQKREGRYISQFLQFKMEKWNNDNESYEFYGIVLSLNAHKLRYECSHPVTGENVEEVETEKIQIVEFQYQ